MLFIKFLAELIHAADSTKIVRKYFAEYFHILNIFPKLIK
jgi:hypothetical protein